MLILQVFFGVAPVLLLIAFVMFKMYETKPLGFVIIGLIFACNTVYMILARRYNILNSGRNGEKNLYKAVKKLEGNNIIFVNLPIRYKRGRSEVDNQPEGCCDNRGEKPLGHDFGELESGKVASAEVLSQR